jgi:hypothetical protein
MQLCISAIAVVPVCLTALVDELVFIEAESFADKGGWVVDQQYARDGVAGTVGTRDGQTGRRRSDNSTSLMRCQTPFSAKRNIRI